MRREDPGHYTPRRRQDSDDREADAAISEQLSAPSSEKHDLGYCGSEEDQLQRARSSTELQWRRSCPEHVQQLEREGRLADVLEDFARRSFEAERTPQFKSSLTDPKLQENMKDYLAMQKQMVGKSREERRKIFKEYMEKKRAERPPAQKLTPEQEAAEEAFTEMHMKSQMASKARRAATSPTPSNESESSSETQSN